MQTSLLAKACCVVGIGLFVFGCGGGSESKTPTTTNSSEATPKDAKPTDPTSATAADSAATPTAATPPTKPDDAANANPATPAAPAAKDDISGQWCGKQVSDAASCKGDEVFFADLKTTGENVSGEVCEAYKKDCSPLDTSTFKSNTLNIAYKFMQGTKQHTVTGTLQLGPDGTLSGEFKSTKGKKALTKKLYKIK